MSLLFAIITTILFILVVVTFLMILYENINLSGLEAIVLGSICIVSAVLLFLNIKNFKQIQYTAPQYNIEQMKQDFEPRTVYVDYDSVFLNEMPTPGTLEETVYFNKHEWIYYDDKANKPKPESTSMPRPEYLMEN